MEALNEVKRKGIEPLSKQKQALIVNNVVKACKDINQLNKTGYNFLSLASGFIAHYNLQGFIDYYEGGGLKEEILRLAPINQWENFRPGEENYEYYSSKAQVYNAIIGKLAKEDGWKPFI
jgi:hypothetical protein